METRVRHEGNKFIKETNGLKSLMEYEAIDDHTVVFYHTYVPEELRGKGIAKEIIKEGLDWAIQEKLDIIPSCSAVRIFIERNENYKAYLMK